MPDFYSEGEEFNSEQEESAKTARLELLELLKNKSFRKFVFNILKEGYIFTTTFTKSSQGYFNEGKREAALRWFNAILDIDPNIFSKMCLEFRNKE